METIDVEVTIQEQISAEASIIESLSAIAEIHDISFEGGVMESVVVPLVDNQYLYTISEIDGKTIWAIQFNRGFIIQTEDYSHDGSDQLQLVQSKWVELSGDVGIRSTDYMKVWYY